MWFVAGGWSCDMSSCSRYRGASAAERSTMMMMVMRGRLRTVLFSPPPHLLLRGPTTLTTSIVSSSRTTTHLLVPSFSSSFLRPQERGYHHHCHLLTAWRSSKSGHGHAQRAIVSTMPIVRIPKGPTINTSSSSSTGGTAQVGEDEATSRPPSETGESMEAVQGLAPALLTKEHGDATALEKHVSFWDRRKTGIIYPTDTYNGLRALGFNVVFSVAVALAFHILHTSYWTSTSWLPNPFFPVFVKRIHRAKHGSDTETYNVDGAFVPDKFEEIFQRYDRSQKGGLTYRELLNMMVYNRNAGDLLGWSFQFFLWSSLWLLAADPATGVLSKEDILAHYDGTLYYRVEARRRAGERLPVWRWGTAWISSSSTRGGGPIMKRRGGEEELKEEEEVDRHKKTQ